MESEKKDEERCSWFISLTCFLQALMFFRTDDVGKIYRNLTSEAKSNFWAAFSSHLVALVTAWMGFSIGYLVYDHSKQEMNKLVHYQIVNQIKPYYDEYCDSCGGFPSYLFSIVNNQAKMESKPSTRYERIEHIINSDTSHYFTDSKLIPQFITFGKASMKVLNNAKLYISKDELERNQIERNNMDIAMGIDMLKALNGDTSFKNKESYIYYKRLPPSSLISIYYHKYYASYYPTIDTLSSNTLSILSAMDSLKASMIRMQLAIDEINSQIGVIEPPITSESIITNIYPGNKISDTLFNAKLRLVELNKRYNEKEFQNAKNRAHIIIGKIVIPSLQNWEYIEKAINTPDPLNPAKTVLLILLFALIATSIMFRFIILRFFKFV